MIPIDVLTGGKAARGRSGEVAGPKCRYAGCQPAAQDVRVAPRARPGLPSTVVDQLAVKALGFGYTPFQ